MTPVALLTREAGALVAKAPRPWETKPVYDDEKLKAEDRYWDCHLDAQLDAAREEEED